MNVTVENLAACKKLLRIELDPQEVEKAFEEMTREYQRRARLPGFRAGKAPRGMVERRFATEIEKEVKKKLVPDAYRKALQEQKIDPVGYPDFEEIQFGRGRPLQFAATLETAPEFELPEYKGLPIRLERKAVTNDDVERAITTLREQRVDYRVVSRPVQQGDIAVVNYTGTSEGKPLTEFAPTARGLTEQKNFWIQTSSDAFIPGFAAQLLGAASGEKRTVNVEFPADFVTPELAGKPAAYEVEVVEVREKILPELNDELAKSFGADNVEKLREGVRHDLENELRYSQDRDMRNQVIKGLLERVAFELPESIVTQETRNIVYDIVRENQQRGISEDVINRQKDAIYGAATATANDRIKTAFLFRKIAEKEGIKVEENEVLQRIHQMAAAYEMPPKDFLKQLQERNGVPEVYDQLRSEKVIAMLVTGGRIEEVEPGSKTR